MYSCCIFFWILFLFSCLTLPFFIVICKQISCYSLGKKSVIMTAGSMIYIYIYMEMEIYIKERELWKHLLYLNPFLQGSTSLRIVLSLSSFNPKPQLSLAGGSVVVAKSLPTLCLTSHLLQETQQPFPIFIFYWPLTYNLLSRFHAVCSRNSQQPTFT